MYYILLFLYKRVIILLYYNIGVLKMSNLKYKKQLVLLSFLMIICIIGTISFILKFNMRSSYISSIPKNNISNNTNIEIIIPNVTNKNTVFNMSDTQNKAETFSISANKRLLNYNLYYCIKFDNTNYKIADSDYIIFNDLILILEENCSILFKYELNGCFSNDAYEIKISNIENKEIFEKPSQKELAEEQVDKTESTEATSPYYIKVNYKANVVTIYAKDDADNYTVPYKAMICSCGTYTPKSGVYKTTNKYVWRPLIHNVYGQYATRIVGSILFHSVPYSSNSNDTLLYKQYDKLGTKASSGCIRLTVADSKWIYNNCPSGTMVEFYSDSNPGPLGKPTAQKISSNLACRNWDPTDPKEGNPWHINEEIENTVNNQNNNKHIVDNSTTNEQITDDTVVDIPTNNETDTDNIVLDTPSTNEPSTDDTVVDTPSNNEPIIDLSIKNELITNNLLHDNVM